ncbi:hypothetical protein BDV98DRAFT_577845, partial [Pterulicium gracile]
RPLLEVFNVTVDSDNRRLSPLGQNLRQHHRQRQPWPLTPLDTHPGEPSQPCSSQGGPYPSNRGPHPSNRGPYPPKRETSPRRPIETDFSV